MSCLFSPGSKISCLNTPLDALLNILFINTFMRPVGWLLGGVKIQAGKHMWKRFKKGGVEEGVGGW